MIRLIEEVTQEINKLIRLDKKLKKIIVDEALHTISVYEDVYLNYKLDKSEIAIFLSSLYKLGRIVNIQDKINYVENKKIILYTILYIEDKKVVLHKSFSTVRGGDFLGILRINETNTILYKINSNSYDLDKILDKESKFLNKSKYTDEDLINIYKMYTTIENTNIGNKMIAGMDTTVSNYLKNR